MLPYTSDIILDNINQYRIVKTETVFGFAPDRENYVNSSLNSPEPLNWIFSNGQLDRTLKDLESRSFKSKLTTSTPEIRSKKETKALGKKHKGKVKKCIYKLLKKGKKHRKRKGIMGKKYMLPLILGLFAAKSLLIPIALKAIAFISAKGLMMGFFSTILASVLSLKGMFEHSHGWNRKDDTKTQVEIIQVPSKSDDHIYYDNYYKRGDYNHQHY